jgi:hypothetical protein
VWLGALLVALDPQIGISISQWLCCEEEQEPEPDPEHDIGEAILLEQEQAIEWFIENNLLHKATDDIRAYAIIC